MPHYVEPLVCLLNCDLNCNILSLSLAAGIYCVHQVLKKHNTIYVNT